VRPESKRHQAQDQQHSDCDMNIDRCENLRSHKKLSLLRAFSGNNAAKMQNNNTGSSKKNAGFTKMYHPRIIKHINIILSLNILQRT
jgi:hypothetical protein